MNGVSCLQNEKGSKRGRDELPPIPQTPPKGDRVLGFKLLGTDIPERLVQSLMVHHDP